MLQVLNKEVDPLAAQRILYDRFEDLSHFNDDLAMDLMNLNFKSKYIVSELHRIFVIYFDESLIPRYNLLRTLGRVFDDTVPRDKSLNDVHTLYAKGYMFLENIALYKAKFSHWPEDERTELYNRPEVDQMVRKVIAEIESGTILFHINEEGPLYSKVEKRNTSS